MSGEVFAQYAKIDGIKRVIISLIERTCPQSVGNRSTHKGIPISI